MEVREQACISDERFELISELEKSILENFRDPVCLGIVNVLNEAKKPAECINCRQIFCYDCAHDLQNRKRTCPLCRHDFQIGSMNHKLLSILLDIECKCEYFRQGCTHRAPLKVLYSHQKECTYKDRKELEPNANQANRRNLKIFDKEESRVIDDLAKKIGDLPLDDETFNELMAAGAFDKNGNIDFAKIQKVLLSKDLRVNKNINPQNVNPAKLEQVKKGNQLALGKGDNLDSNKSKPKSLSIITNFIGDLFAGRGSKDKKEESKSNQAGQSYPQAMNENNTYVVPNYVPLDTRYKCPSNHSVGLVHNLALLPFTSNANYQKNMFYCRQCQQTMPVGPAGVVHCLSCPFDICSECFRVPLTCKNNDLLQKTKDLTQAPLHYKTNEAVCNICDIKIVPTNSGILVCTNCHYHICLDCARPPVVCSNFHVLRRETNPNFFPRGKFKCSDCKKVNDFKARSIGVLMCAACSYYRCEDCFINSRPQMKFYCPKNHTLRRIFKFQNPGLISWQMLDRYRCHSCKDLKALDERGVWNCHTCKFHVCPTCMKKV